MRQFVKVFECPNPECKGRVLKQVVHIPVVRTFDYLRNGDICASDDACTTECTLEEAMDENYSDDAFSKDYVYCANCGKYWTSIGDGPDSLESAGGLKTIPVEYYAKWLDNEFYDQHAWTWEIRESIADHDWLLIIRKDDEIEAMFNTCCADLAGEWWYDLKWTHPTPENFICSAELECEPENEEDWEDLLKSYAIDGELVAAKRVVLDGEYEEQNATPFTLDLQWEYTKQFAKHTKGMDVAIVPAWAVCYLVNGDMDNLTEEELELAQNSEKHYEVLSVAPESDCIVCPWTNLLSDCYEVTVRLKTNQEED